MSPVILFLLLGGAVVLIGAAIFLDHEGYTRPAVGVALAGLTCFGTMMCTAGEVDWGNQSPSPSPSAPARTVPRYDPEKCIELQWLDGRWTCIPRDEAG